MTSVDERLLAAATGLVITSLLELSIIPYRYKLKIFIQYVRWTCYVAKCDITSYQSLVYENRGNNNNNNNTKSNHFRTGLLCML